MPARLGDSVSARGEPVRTLREVAVQVLRERESIRGLDLALGAQRRGRFGLERRPVAGRQGGLQKSRAVLDGLAHGELEERLGACAQLVEHPRRRQPLRIVEGRAAGFDRIRVAARPARSIEHLGDLRQRVDDLAGPGEHRNAGAGAAQPQRRVAPAHRDEALVLVALVALARGERRAGIERAVDQERLHEPHRVLLDARRRERVHVERPDLHVAHAAALQRDCRLLPGAGDLLRSDKAVVLVLDLQEVRVELAVLSVDDEPDVPVRRVGSCRRLVQGPDVVGRGIVGNPELSLRLVLVADVAHAQRRRERFVDRAPTELGKRMWRVAEKGTADRRRRPEQQRHEPPAAVEVAYQREVPVGGERTERYIAAALRLPERGPERPGQREVEVHARDDLHHPAVAVAQAAPYTCFMVPTFELP